MTLHSALGGSNLAKKSALKRANLEIRGVDNADAGQFSCVADGNRQEVLLFVISGKQRTLGNSIASSWKYWNTD